MNKIMKTKWDGFFWGAWSASIVWCIVWLVVSLHG